MGSWKQLKTWQKVGFTVGALHFIVYCFLLFIASIAPIGESGMGFLLFFMEVPWGIVLRAIDLQALVLIPSLYAALLGSIFYGTAAASIFFAIKWLSRRV